MNPTTRTRVAHGHATRSVPSSVLLAAQRATQASQHATQRIGAARARMGAGVRDRAHRRRQATHQTTDKAAHRIRGAAARTARRAGTRHRRDVSDTVHDVVQRRRHTRERATRSRRGADAIADASKRIRDRRSDSGQTRERPCADTIDHIRHAIDDATDALHCRTDGRVAAARLAKAIAKRGTDRGKHAAGIRHQTTDHRIQATKRTGARRRRDTRTQRAHATGHTRDRTARARTDRGDEIGGIDRRRAAAERRRQRGHNIAERLGQSSTAAGAERAAQLSTQLLHTRTHVADEVADTGRDRADRRTAPDTGDTAAEVVHRLAHIHHDVIQATGRHAHRIRDIAGLTEAVGDAAAQSADRVAQVADGIAGRRGQATGAAQHGDAGH
ncbi:hypothetical protein KCV01_g8145, partial [Aureobasidium melanogenum]